MSFDFAIKDLIRKKEQTLPYLITVILAVSLLEFLIYVSNSLGLNMFYPISYNSTNSLFFSGLIKIVFQEFQTLIIVLVLILSVTIIIIVGTTFISNRKRDISIMKALGTLPRKLYSYYLTEIYLLFLLGFVIGMVFGLLFFSIYYFILSYIGYPLLLKIDIFYTLIFLGVCLLGIFLIPGYKLRKIGRENVSEFQSKDIPFNYDASKNFKFIPKWLMHLGFTFKLSIMGIIRKKGEFKRYFITFFILSLVLFSFGLGILVVRASSVSWVERSQGNNIIAIGNKDVLNSYEKMYNMFSDSNIFVDKNNINFLNPDYLFNSTDLSQLSSLQGIDKIDPRLISFCNVKEISGTLIQNEGYKIVGQSRTGNYPIMGVNQSDLIQSFETEGNFSLNSINMSIGDGLATNFFENPFYEKLLLTNYHRRFEISSVVIDSFYSGYSGYVDINQFRSILNLTSNEVNILLIKVDSKSYPEIKNNLTSIIASNLGSNFTFVELNPVFAENVNFINSLMIYPYLFFFLLSLVIFSTFYHYQKGGINEKVKDFLIMRSIGTKRKKLKRILFLEAFYAIIPSCLLSLAVGMIFNRLFLLQRALMPPLYVPYLVITIITVIFLIINYLSVIPIVKKIDRRSVMEFAVF
ncbi:MAG: FtsX-like permease family protein [Candidatus Lokiarchaeota archaeon]